MQLKKDLGYAVKVICTIDKARRAGSGESLSLSEISFGARVPRSITFRICESLAREGILATNDYGTYSIRNRAKAVTMLDVIRAFNVQTDPFVLFDKEFEYSDDNSLDFSKYHKEIENIYKAILLFDPQKEV